MSDTPEYDPVDTTCPNCAVGCRLRYDGSSARASGIEGAPVNREGRLCPKGINAFEGLGEDRLTKPLVRRDGDLEAVSWEEALARIERGVGSILEERGADSLCFLGAPRCTNEENYLLGKLARALGTNNVDNRARSCHEAAEGVLRDRLGLGAMTNSIADLGETDCLFVAGADPAARQPVAFDSYLRPAINDGATALQLDPNANRTTRLVDIHLDAEPGTDALAVTLLAAIIVREGLLDREFIDVRTNGFERYRRQLAQLDVAAGARALGLDRATLRDAAFAFGRADSAAVVTGTGIETEEGTATADALLNLLLLTGNLGRRGTGFNFLRGLTNEQGANDVGARPDCLPGYVSLPEQGARDRLAEVWGFEPPTEPGLAETEALRSFGEGIRGAFVFGENPAINELDTGRIERGMETLELLVVADLRATETTAHADVVLPASAWAEKRGTVTNLDRQVQALRPAAESPGETRSDLTILRALGERLTEAQFPATPEAVFSELVSATPLYRGLSYDGIGDGSQRWPLAENGAGTENGVRVLHRGRFASGQRRAPIAPVPEGLLETARRTEIDRRETASGVK